MRNPTFKTSFSIFKYNVDKVLHCKSSQAFMKKSLNVYSTRFIYSFILVWESLAKGGIILCIGIYYIIDPLCICIRALYSHIHTHTHSKSPLGSPHTGIFFGDCRKMENSEETQGEKTCETPHKK